MQATRTVFLCLIAALGNSLVAADEGSPAKPNPLFANHEILEVTIKAPFAALMYLRPTEDEMRGQLTYRDAESGEVVLDVGIRTRGRYRQQMRICPFAPLRLNFKKEQTKKTLFTKTDKVKLVTHCRDGSERYSQGVLREYLTYRFFNAVTEQSFGARLLRVTYVDSDTRSPDRVNYAFLIEHSERLAKRLDLQLSTLGETTVESLDSPHTNLGSVFQYLIGNTDFSPVLGAAGEVCCHNYILLGPDDGALLAVPYDFDMSGMVNAKHAAPNPKFGLRNVRQRLYRGRCHNNKHLDNSLQVFRDRRQDIYRLVSESEPMKNGTRKYLRKYIDDFYDTIDNPKSVNKRMRSKCV